MSGFKSILNRPRHRESRIESLAPLLDSGYHGKLNRSLLLLLCPSLLFLPSTIAKCAPHLPSTYALSFTPACPRCATMASPSGEFFLCQPCLSLTLEDLPLTRLFISGNLSDLPDGIACCNCSSAAATSAPTSAGHAREGGIAREPGGPGCRMGSALLGLQRQH